MFTSAEVIKVVTTFFSIFSWPVVVLIAAILFRPAPRFKKRIAELEYLQSFHLEALRNVSAALGLVNTTGMAATGAGFPQI